METRMALQITRRIWLVVAIIAFTTTMARTESEIPENKVIVDIRPVFLRGYDGMLECRFNGAPLAVFWLKGADLATGTNLVTWYPPPRVVSGSGYVSGKYNLTEDFSLVIHNVTDDDAGRYICRISNFNGFILRNYTEATVKTPPQGPFPTIDQCPTGADGRGTEPCIMTQETGAVSTELTCRTTGAPIGVVSLSWTLGGTTIPLQEPHRSTNPDGVKEDVMVAINATPSADPYACVAILPTTTRRQAAMSVIVNSAPILIATTTDSVMTTNVTPPTPDPSETKAIVITVVIIFIIVLVVVVILIFIKSINKKCRKSRYHHLPQIKDKGVISYFELGKVVERFNIASLNLIVAELIKDSKRELKPECTKADLYTYLCEWKESSGGSAMLLSSAMEKNDLENELQIVEDFFGSADNTVSDDDLEHICWHVHSCRETVKPIVGSSFTKSTKPGDDGHISAPSRCDEIRDDLQIMKRWRDATTYGDEDDQFDDTVKFRRKSEEIGLTSKNTQSMPSNQMIKLCRALEKAAKKTRDGDGQVYHQLSKTFYKIREEYKSELKDEVLKEFALNITKQHYQRLGNTLKLSADAIAIRNEEDLQMFGTDDMLKAWVQDQKCSTYEIRRRLRQAAEQCNREDIADNFISKEQSEVMTSTTKLPAYVTITNEKQSLGASASGSNESGNGTSSQSVPQRSHGDLEETQTSIVQPAANITESEVGLVSVISRDELDRIGRYAGSEILLAFCKKYDVTGVSEQQSPDEIVNLLKPTLDSEHEIIKRKAGRDTPRKTLRQLLENKHPRDACLIARRKPDDIFNVELIDLAFRLIMADVYPFAKALNISDQVLTPYKRNLGPHNLRQGTVQTMEQVNTDDRLKMVRPLKQAGYSEEARALYFGFEISFGDVIEVENRVDKVELAKQLGVSDDVKSTEPANQGEDDTLHLSALLRWRDTVRSSTYNHRLVLADAVFTMGEKKLALDIISGVFRNREINKPVSELLAAAIPERQLPTLSKVLDQKVKNGQNCQEVITAWVGETIHFSRLRKKQLSLSNQLLGAGFYAFAREIMTGAWNRDKKAGQKEGTENGNAAPEELRQESTPIDNQGEQEGEVEKEGTDKDKNGDPLEDNTGKKGPSQNSEDKKSSREEATDAKNVDAEKSKEENASTKERGAKHGAIQNSEEIKSSGKGATDTKNVDVEISREENARTKEEDAKRGKENDGTSEEEANINKNRTDGEQISIDEDWFVVPREDVMQEKIGDGSAEPDKNATENVDTKEQGNTLHRSDERKRDESSEAHLPDTTMDPSGEQGVHDVSQDMEAIVMSRSQFIM